MSGMSELDSKQLGEWLCAYLDGELGDEDTERVEGLLKEDAGARRRLDELRRAAEAVSALPRHRAPASILEDVQTRAERAVLLGVAEESDTSLEVKRPRLVSALSMAAMLTFAGAGVWYLAQGDGAAESRRTTRVAEAPVAESDGANRLDSNGPRRRGATEGRKDLLAAATLDQKLAVGMGWDAVRSHAFDNEPLRLQIRVESEKKRDSLSAHLLSHLETHHGVDLAKSHPKAVPVATGSAAEGSVATYYRGAPGRNFSDSSQQQILVRASRRGLEGMMAALAGRSARGERVALQAGPLLIRGWERAKVALYDVGEPPPGATSEKEAFGDVATPPLDKRPTGKEGQAMRSPADVGALLDGLARLLTKATTETSPASSDSPSALSAAGTSASSKSQAATAEGRSAAQGEAINAAEEHRGRSARETSRKGTETVRSAGQRPQRASTASSGPSSDDDRATLVQRRFEAARKRREPRQTTVPDGGLRTPKAEALGESSDGVARAGAGRVAAEEFVTIVVQFIVEKPAAARASKRATKSKDPPRQK